MTVLFFILALISAGLTYNVLRPAMRHPKRIVPSFLAGWLVGDLALHVIAVQAFLVFLFVFAGVVKGFWGGVSILIFTASWLVLSYHYFSGYKAKVLMDGIVIPHREDDSHANWTRHRELDVARLMRPFSDFKDDQVELLKNIEYCKRGDLSLKLDIRRGREPAENAPVLLQIHGGAWTFGYGSKNEQGVPLMVEMAKRGWVSVAISYRLLPRFGFPDPLVDCKQAIAWIKENIAQYGGNPDFIVLTGGSAGGHLVSLTALTAGQGEFQPGFENVNTQVQGCVPFYGIYDFSDAQNLQASPALEIVLRKKILGKTKAEDSELYEKYSPLSYVNKNAPPFLIIHGDKDSLTSLGAAQYFASELDKASDESVEFAEIAGAQHAFDVFASMRSDYVVAGIAERLQQWHRDAQKKTL